VTLREATKDLHHAAEAHVVGSRMSEGTISPGWWADWVGALRIVHGTLDPCLPEPVQRVRQLDHDLSRCDQPARLNLAALRFAEQLDQPGKITGAAYVFTGAHLMGGAVMERRLGDRLPCAHLRWGDRRAALNAWQPYRTVTDAGDEARTAFMAVLAIMDEIARS
jgi:heme oxygenase